MIDEATYNELDRYFHSQMSAEEKSAFVSRLNTNAELHAEFQWLNTMLGGMKQQGRSVMKQTIAGALAGIPSEDVEKYKPSMNRKSFFKKYWWVIAGAVIAIAAAVAIYVYNTQPADSENSHDTNEADPHATMLIGDSVGSDTCNESSLNLDENKDGSKADSIFKSQSEGRIAIRETVDVYYGNGVYCVDDTRLIGERKMSQTKIGFPPVDTIKHPYVAPIVWAGAEDEYRNKEKTKSMGVTTGYKPFPPYTYKLDDDLMLNAPYYTCKGFKWEGMGTDTVYMTTSDGIEYMLLRGKGVKELVPIKGRGEPVNYK